MLFRAGSDSLPDCVLHHPHSLQSGSHTRTEGIMFVEHTVKFLYFLAINLKKDWICEVCNVTNVETYTWAK